MMIAEFLLPHRFEREHGAWFSLRGRMNMGLGELVEVEHKKTKEDPP
jgi:hypothetical protein